MGSVPVGRSARSRRPHRSCGVHSGQSPLLLSAPAIYLVLGWTYVVNDETAPTASSRRPPLDRALALRWCGPPMNCDSEVGTVDTEAGKSAFRDSEHGMPLASGKLLSGGVRARLSRR